MELNLVQARSVLKPLIYKIQAEGPNGVARGNKLNIILKMDFLTYNTPWPPISVHKKFQPNRSSRLAGCYIYIQIQSYAQRM